jgi:hypothetical protein
LFGDLNNHLKKKNCECVDLLFFFSFFKDYK